MRRKVILQMNPVVINDYEDLVRRIKGWHIFGIEVSNANITSYEGVDKTPLKGILKVDENDNIVIVIMNERFPFIQTVSENFEELDDAEIYSLENRDDLIKFLNYE